MARKQKDWVNFTCKMAKDAAEKLSEMSEETSVAKTIVVELAIRDQYERFKKTGKLKS